MRARGEALEDGALHERHHRTWSRRQFLSGLGLALAGASIPVGGAPLRSYARSPLITHLAASGTDRVLVLIQLGGGNDGLNTVVPVSNDIYYQRRPTIAVSPEQAVLIDQDTGLHPRLAPLMPLYSDGRMGIVHGVGYPDPNLSHFTSTDVWITASDVSDIRPTGWMGRSLDFEYPNFEISPPDRPLAVQLGSGSPQMFQGAVSNMGMSLPNIQLFDRLVSDGKVFDESFVPGTTYGTELSFVRAVANDSFQYAEAVQTADEQGTNLVEYPSGNSLAADLSVVGRLIRGDLGTTIYHLSMGGFDTHAGQSGAHATLLGRLADAVSSFMEDLKADGLDERVLVATFSEFGRRVQQNASGGTDHGTAAPLFVFGGSLSGGMFGSMPSLSDLDVTDNMKHGVDFRSVYSTLLVDWLGVDEAAMPDILGQQFDRLGFVDSSASVAREPSHQPVRARLGSAWPNPFTARTMLELSLERTAHVSAALHDMQGRRIRSIMDRTLPAGSHRMEIDGSGLASGVYLVRVHTADGAETRRITLIR
ncbi:MAG: DUF1501 domain-containing protein [Rhodothermales bacterium]|nr:DUF1501 domain-containing protein [Rhodothermales bacterium]